MTIPIGTALDDGNVRLEIVHTSADTGGELFELLATYAPGSRPPPPHYHPEQAEDFDVTAGALKFVLNGTPTIVRAGESIHIPARTVHFALNASAVEPATAQWRTRPALRSDEFFASVYAVETRGGHLLDRVLVARAFPREFTLASPPRVVQSCVFPLLAVIARLAGRRLPSVAPGLGTDR